MQFISNGPEIPERLIQMHEDGKVVFFCGAGISYSAGLPSFKGLVDKLVIQLGTSLNTLQKKYYKEEKYDIVITLLESNYPGGRRSVRKALHEVLLPDLTTINSKKTHEALLQLSKTRSGQIHLVTTNFDCIFEEIINAYPDNQSRFIAPFLPMPKSRWNGLVYLHGLLPDNKDEEKLDDLVLSSGDFGLAYLTNRWASRFVSELFRNYTVCFIGYSINDPILRYMMDSLAADRLLGETPHEMFAFGSSTIASRKAEEYNWRTKNVTPILYIEDDNHSMLHNSLHKWSIMYRDGLFGREQLVNLYAYNKPIMSTKEDNFISRLIWGISDPSGIPAKRFAELDPVPSIDWLDAFSEKRYESNDLFRFGIHSMSEIDSKMLYSLISRPTPCKYSKNMKLTGSGVCTNKIDKVMYYIACWLTRHLNDPKLIFWINSQGETLHEEFSRLIIDKIEEIEELIRKNKNDEINQMIKNAPNSVPDSAMKILWQLLICGKFAKPDNIFYNSIFQFADPNTQSISAIRFKLTQLLTPLIEIREPSFMFFPRKEKNNQRIVNEIVSWDIVLSSEYAQTVLDDAQRHPSWQLLQPDLIETFTKLLKDVLDLMHDMGGAYEFNDASYICRPSIEEHKQNNDYHNWTILIDLCRDAWIATAEKDPTRAKIIAESWWHEPYPIFKRLALNSATKKNIISDTQALDWILSNNRKWLWSEETQYEIISLIVSLAPNLECYNMTRLENAILKGPSYDLFQNDVDENLIKSIIEKKIWLFLSKIKSNKGNLSPESLSRIKEISIKYKDLELSDDERDEFPFWQDDVGIPIVFYNKTPEKIDDLIEWLKNNRKCNYSQSDDWRQRCRNDIRLTSNSLKELAKQNIWLDDRWSEALQVWSETELLKESWSFISKILVTAPDKVIRSIADSLSNWLLNQAAIFKGQDDAFFSLINLTLEKSTYIRANNRNDIVAYSINSNEGKLTTALLRWLKRKEIKDSQGIDKRVKPIFSSICNKKKIKFQNARNILATDFIALFRVDRDWTVEFLIPFFDWNISKSEASYVWQGFLYSPRYYKPLLVEIKKSFLACSKNPKKLGRYLNNYAALLTIVALDFSDLFTATELMTATKNLPEEGLASVIDTLTRTMRSAGEQRKEYFENRILRYIKEIWPKSNNIITPMVSNAFALLCISSREMFVEALTEFKYYLKSVNHIGFTLSRLLETDICKDYPNEALVFIDILIVNNKIDSDLIRRCIKVIVNADENVKKSPYFKRFEEFYSSS